MLLTSSSHATARSTPLGEGFSGAQDHLPQLLDEQTTLSAVARVPASVMREIFLNGTPGEVVDQAAQWRDAGPRYIVVANYGFLRPY